MSHVRDAIADLQREVKDSYHSVVRAIEALEIAADSLSHHLDMPNSYENLMAVDRAAAQVRTSIARSIDTIYDAVREVNTIA